VKKISNGLMTTRKRGSKLKKKFIEKGVKLP
jgi:hypothetical protein